MLTPNHRSLLQRIARLKYSKSKAQRQEGRILEEQLDELSTKKALIQPAPEALLDEIEKVGASERMIKELTAIRVELESVREFLHLDIVCTQAFGLIPEPIRTQLKQDNQQMVLARLGRLHPAIGPSFDTYCRYAHLQIEELVSYCFFELNSQDSQRLEEFWLSYQ